jgi:hypothetical protein
MKMRLFLLWFKSIKIIVNHCSKKRHMKKIVALLTALLVLGLASGPAMGDLALHQAQMMETVSKIEMPKGWLP